MSVKSKFLHLIDTYKESSARNNTLSRNLYNVSIIESEQGVQLAETFMKALVQEVIYFDLASSRPQSYEPYIEHILSRIWDKLSQSFSHETPQLLKKVFSFVFRNQIEVKDDLKEVVKPLVSSLKLEAENQKTRNMSMQSISRVNKPQLLISNSNFSMQKNSVREISSILPKAELNFEDYYDDYFGQEEQDQDLDEDQDEQLKRVLQLSLQYGRLPFNLSTKGQTKNQTYNQVSLKPSLPAATKKPKPSSNKLLDLTSATSATYVTTKNYSNFEQYLANLKDKNPKTLMNKFQQQLGFDMPVYTYDGRTNICTGVLNIPQKQIPHIDYVPKIQGRGSGGETNSKNKAETEAAKDILRQVYQKHYHIWNNFERVVKAKNIEL